MVAVKVFLKDMIQATSRGSQLINYDLPAFGYANHRQVVAVERCAHTLRDVLARTEVKVVTSLCCGQGTNERALLEALGCLQPSRLFMGDYSEGMLMQARVNLTEYEFVEIQRLDVLTDFHRVPTSAFLMLFHCIQHFNPAGGDFSILERIFTQAFEKLVDGGELFIVVSTPEQIFHGLPFCGIDTELGTKYAEVFPKQDVVLQSLKAAGFEASCEKEHKHFISEGSLYNAENWSDPLFQACSSFFQFVEANGDIASFNSALTQTTTEDLMSLVQRAMSFVSSEGSTTIYRGIKVN